MVLCFFFHRIGASAGRERKQKLGYSHRNQENGRSGSSEQELVGLMPDCADAYKGGSIKDEKRTLHLQSGSLYRRSRAAAEFSGYRIGGRQRLYVYKPYWPHIYRQQARSHLYS